MSAPGAIFAFDRLPGFPVACPLSLKAALEELSAQGDRCPGAIDAGIPLACSGPRPIASGAMAELLASCGFALVPVADCMGAASLFFLLPEDDPPYARAWSILERGVLNDLVSPILPVEGAPRL